VAIDATQQATDTSANNISYMSTYNDSYFDAICATAIFAFECAVVIAVCVS
jgi:hypothetical protein